METPTTSVRPVGVFPVALRIGSEELLVRDQLLDSSITVTTDIEGYAGDRKKAGGGDDDEKMEDYVGHLRVLVGPDDVTASIRGVMVPSRDVWTYYGYDTAAEDIERLPGYAKKKDKKMLKLVFDTPGGYVEGIPEAGLALYEMREWANITAYVHNANSAGAWLASQADEIIVKPSGTVGSVGVRSMHISYKKMLDEQGVVVTQFSMPEKKIEMSPYVELTEEAAKHAQNRVNLLYDEFIEAVARGRGKDKSYVKENSGEGRVVTAQDALSAGMIDQIVPASQWDV